MTNLEHDAKIVAETNSSLTMVERGIIAVKLELSSKLVVGVLSSGRSKPPLALWEELYDMARKLDPDSYG